MLEVIFKIWFAIAILPFIIFLEGNEMFSDFLKKRNIYSHWDIWHSLLVVFIILFIIFWFGGYH